VGHDCLGQVADYTMHPILMDCGKIVTRDHGIMEHTCLPAFWSISRDQQLGRVIDMAHGCRDLGNNCIVQTRIVAIVLDNQRRAA
jgi:hypothetical protein